MFRPRHKRLRSHSIQSLIPNMLTVVGLCFGLTSIRFALQELWELAVACILVAGIIDGLDGRVARILKASTKFGAHLDSLCDFICFGVAPATVLYLWVLYQGGGAGWGVVLLFSVCMALRLARFNVSEGDPDRPVWATRYFVGMPAPAASGITMLPMILCFVFETEILRHPLLVGAETVGVALLMVSRIPMYSGRSVRKVRHEHVLPMLLLVGILIAATLAYPWQAFAILGIGYLGSIPFSIRNYRIQAASEANAISDSESEAASQTSGEQTSVEIEQQPKSGDKPSDLPGDPQGKSKRAAGRLSVYESGVGWRSEKDVADNDV